MMPLVNVSIHHKHQNTPRQSPNSNKGSSFHLSQPFSQSYRSNLPTSLTYFMQLRLQRLLTLRTWCGYRYDMAWKWTTTHHFSWGNKDAHWLWMTWLPRRFLPRTSSSKEGRRKWQPPIQASKHFFSQQMKLQSVCTESDFPSKNKDLTLKIE